MFKFYDYNPWPTSNQKFNVAITTKKLTNVTMTTKRLTQDTAFNIIISDLGISAPIITGIDPADEEKYDIALRDGVLLLPGKGEVGEPGNVVIYGHSSSDDILGRYNTVFSKLNNLKNNDEIKIQKDGKNYIYFVTGKKIVAATDLSVLNQTTDETLTLITCWPIGTDKERLIVTAKQA